MLDQIIVFLSILLVASVVFHKFEKKKDQNIKEELRATLTFVEEKYEASMEFNSYFLTNYSEVGIVSIGFNSKHYVLYNDSGDAVIKESEEKFSGQEKIFYGLKDPDSSNSVN